MWQMASGHTAILDAEIMADAGYDYKQKENHEIFCLFSTVILFLLQRQRCSLQTKQ